MPDVIEKPAELDTAQFIKDRNANDAAKRAGKEPPAPTPGKPAAKEEAKPVVADDDHLVTDDDEDGNPAKPEHTGRRSVRSLKRELNQTRQERIQALEEAAELRGRLAAMQE